MPTNKKPQPSPTAFLKEVGILLGAGGLTFFVMFLAISKGGMFKITDTAPSAAASSPEDPMQAIHNKVAQDAIDQYQIVKRNANLVNTCVHAGFVAAAYLQAKDEPNYQKWRSIEVSDCESAGLSR
jgi:hypothetical protein